MSDDNNGDELALAQQRAEQAEARAQASEESARRLAIKARFERDALASGVPAERVEDAYILAEAKGHLDGADVDLNTGAVRGVEHAVEKATDGLPFEVRHTAAAVDHRHAGRSRGTEFNLSQVKPGDLTEFHNRDPEAFWRMLRKGLRIPSSHYIFDENGQRVREYFHTQIGNPFTDQFKKSRREYLKHMDPAADLAPAEE